MDNLSIDFKKKTVQYEQAQKKFHILQKRSGQVVKYALDGETLKKFNEILAKKQSHDFGVHRKFETLQVQMKTFNKSLAKKQSHEEEMNDKLDALQMNIFEMQIQMNAFKASNDEVQTQMNALKSSTDEIKNLLLSFLAERKA